MNTPAHLIVGTAMFARPNVAGTYTAALLGAAAPDVSLYVMVAVSIWMLGISPEVVFRDLYFSDAWQQVFAIDNSFILWGLLFGLANWKAWPKITAFAGGGLLHIATDFPLHADDGRMHFWPVSDWIFESPVSYWDRTAHAGVIGPLEFVISVTCAVVLFRRFRQLSVRLATIVFMAAEIVSTGIWQFVFDA